MCHMESHGLIPHQTGLKLYYFLICASEVNYDKLGVCLQRISQPATTHNERFFIELEFYIIDGRDIW